MNRSIKILFLALIASGILACQVLSLSQSHLTGKEYYLKLRTDALEAKPDAVGITVDLGSNKPYGVIMDTALDNETISTLISLASGDASLIATTGNGRTDGIQYETVQTASKNFVAVAANFLDKTELVSDYPLPAKAGNIRFYIITPNGVYASKELSEGEVFGGSFYRLYKAGEDVINAFRLSSSP